MNETKCHLGLVKTLTLERVKQITVNDVQYALLLSSLLGKTPYETQWLERLFLKLLITCKCQNPGYYSQTGII